MAKKNLSTNHSGVSSKNQTFFIGLGAELEGLRLAFPTFRVNDFTTSSAFQAGEEIKPAQSDESDRLFAASCYRIALSACLINQLESNSLDQNTSHSLSMSVRSGSNLFDA